MAASGTDRIAPTSEEYRDYINRASDAGLSDSLLLEASNGDVARVKQILECGRVDVNHRSSSGSTALGRAIFHKQLTMVRYLIENGANVELGNVRYGRRPLHTAVQSGSLAIVETLVESHADLNAPDKEGSTPLHLAAYWGFTPIVQYLYDQGAAVRSASSVVERTLESVIDRSDVDTLKFLISNGIDINKPIRMFPNPMSYAAERGKVDIVRFLLDNGGNDDSANLSGLVPAQLAAQQGCLDVLKLIMENVGVRAGLNWDETVLELLRYRVFDKPIAETIAYLVDNHLINVDFRSSDGSTFLHIAVSQSLKLTAKALLQRNSNPIARDGNGHTVWDCAWFSVTPWKWPRSVIQRFVDKFCNKQKQNTSTITSNCGCLKSTSTRDSRYNLFREVPCNQLEVADHNCWRWLHMSINNDALFTSSITKACSVKGYSEEATSRILRFWSDSFLEQTTQETRLRSREPSYKVFREKLELQDEQGSPEVSMEEDEDIYEGVLWETKLPQSMEGQNPEEDFGGTKFIQHQVIESSSEDDAKNGKDKKTKTTNAISIVFPYFDSREKRPSAQAHLENQPGSREDIPKPATSEDSRLPVLSPHISCTLDESYYPGLSDHHFAKRNEDQVVSWVARDENKPERLLLVSQLWLWKLDNIIITACPHITLAETENISFGLIPAMSGQSRHSALLNEDLIMASVLSDYINSIDRPYMAGFQEPVLFMFEKAVATTFDKVRTYMDEVGMASIKIDTERRFMHQINDIRDELKMIESVVVEQQGVWEEFWEDRFKEKDKEAFWAQVVPDIQVRLRGTLEGQTKQIEKYLSRIRKIEGDAERVVEWISSQLDLKSKHAALKEAHNSLILSTAVVGFTVITIIFAPLSFLTSLFALPAEQFVRNQHATVNGTAVYSKSYLGGWMALGEVASLVVTIFVIVFAFIWLKSQSTLGDASSGQPTSKHKAEKPKDIPDRVWAVGVSEEAKERARQRKQGTMVAGSSKKWMQTAHAAKTSLVEFIRGCVSRTKSKTEDPES